MMINSERLWKNLFTLGEIGRQENGGVTRLAYTQEEQNAINFVKSVMEQAGLHVRQDEVGNLIGRREGAKPDAPIVLIGSHIDTVLNGGVFDGSLGILAGIEILHSMREKGIRTEHPIEVCAFRDEEGVRFGFSSIGSRAIAGILKEEQLNYQDKDGITLRQAMEKCGLCPGKYQKAAKKPDEVKVYLELHPEQGKVLETENLPVGVVTGIASSLRLKVTLIGSTDHAGATPMNLRKDALAAAAEIILLVEKEAKDTKTAVGTVGRIMAYPGGINIISGKVEFTIDLRDIDPEVGAHLESQILSSAEEICQKRGIQLEIEELQRVPPAPCEKNVIETIKKSCKELNIVPYELSSGAGHDALQLINICPIGLIFVRSKNGISHHPDEWSSKEDCTHGADVLYKTVLNIAKKIQ